MQLSMAPSGFVCIWCTVCKQLTGFDKLCCLILLLLMLLTWCLNACHMQLKAVLERVSPGSSPLHGKRLFKSPPPSSAAAAGAGAEESPGKSSPESSPESTPDSSCPKTPPESSPESSEGSALQSLYDSSAEATPVTPGTPKWIGNIYRAPKDEFKWLTADKVLQNMLVST